MDDSLMPAWMKDKVRKEESERAKRQAEMQMDISAGLIAERERPEFWKQFEEKLRISVYFLPQLKLAGQVEVFNSGATPSMRVSMSRPGLIPNQTFTDLFLDSNSIRCVTATRGDYAFGFTVSDSKLFVSIQYQTKPMNPEQAAEYVIRHMSDSIQSQSGF